jgi:hypothetical protein
MPKEKIKKPWRFTELRQKSLAKARHEHERLVRLGESVDKKRR